MKKMGKTVYLRSKNVKKLTENEGDNQQQNENQQNAEVI